MLKKITRALLMVLFIHFGKAHAQCDFTATLYGTDTTCITGSTQLFVLLSGGMPPYTVKLATNVSIQTRNNYYSGQNISVYPSKTTTYFLHSVTDALGCSAELIGEVVVPVLPTANSLADPIDGCDQGGGLVAYNLYTRSWMISAGSGYLVNWYEDINGDQLIADPENYITSSDTLVYASLYDEYCESALVPISLSPLGLPIPMAYPAVLEACSDEINGDTAVFQLSTIQEIIAGGANNPVYFYDDIETTNYLPSFYTSPSTTIYATTRQGPCWSDPVPVTLIVYPTPGPGISGSLNACENAPTTLSVDSIYTSYSWSTGTISPNISVNTPGTYTVSVSTAEGCIGSTSVEVTQVNSPSPTIIGSAEICGSENINIEVNPDFTTYSWNNGDNAQSTVINSPGTYTLTVSDELGCVGNTSHTVETRIDLQCRQVIPASNNDTSNGRGGLIIADGIPPYQVSWDGPVSGSQPLSLLGISIIDGLLPGNYEVTVSDNIQCTAICSFTIEDYALTTNCLSNTALSLNPPSSDCDVFSSTTFSLDNLNNNTLLPSTYLTSCLDIPLSDSLLSDSWFSFTANGGISSISFQNEDLESPYFAIFSSAQCFNPIPMKCGIGNDITLDLETTPGTAYYLMIAGGNDNDRGDFSITINSKTYCNTCLVQDSLSVDPLPVNDFYYPGQSVHFCYSISAWEKHSSSWFHALEVQFGGGWDLSTLVVDTPSVCQEGWDWYDSWKSCTTGQTFGPGFAYEYFLGNCDDPDDSFFGPGDNYGCTDIENPTTPPAQFCWTVQVASCPGFSNNDLSVKVNPLSDAQSGSWHAINSCSTNSNANFAAQTWCTTELGLNLQITDNTCDGVKGTATALAIGGTGLYTYQWSTGQTGSMITDLDPGQYSLTVNDGQSEIIQDFNIDLQVVDLNLVSLLLLCEGYTYTIETTSSNCSDCVYNWNNGQEGPSLDVSEPGNYIVTVTGQNGCYAVDSVLVLYNHFVLHNAHITTCLNPFTFSGQVFYESGNYEIVHTALTGCDSIYNLDLTILPEAEIFLEEHICEGETYFIGNNAYSQSGIYTDTIIYPFNCDTIFTLDLTVHPGSEEILSVSICEGQSIELGSNTYNQTGSYEAVLPNASGCDSLVVLELTVLDNSVPTEIFASICGGEVYTLGSNTYDTTGEHTETFINSVGCDSLVTLTLDVNSIQVSFNLENNICFDDFGTITFQGQADPNAVFNWGFDGGTATPGIGSGPHEVSWSTSGLKTVSLNIEADNCVSETFFREVEVENFLATPNISCIGFNDQLAFGWPPIPGATGYDIHVLTGQEGVLNGNIFIVSNLEPGEEVSLEVMAINGGGVCANSANVLSCAAAGDPIIMLMEPIFQMDAENGTIQLVPEDDQRGFNIKGPYPNPTEQEARIELALSGAQLVQMTLMDINGRTQQILCNAEMDKGIHDLLINTQILPPGLYFIKINVANQVITRKLVLVK